MSVKVLHPGLMTTIQDLGRFGSQKFGVIVSGAMDPLSLRIANLLVGNGEGEGALEVTLLGPTLEFDRDGLIAITGGYLQPMIDGEAVPMWRPILIRKGSILQFKSAIKGCRAYVAFAGGIDVPASMGSKSTYLRAAIGGYLGRALQNGDVFDCVGNYSTVSQSLIQQLEKRPSSFTWSVNYPEFINLNRTQTIRVIQGAEFKRFDAASQEAFFSKPYTLTTQADRMGYRLEGETIRLSEKFELLSEGVTYGTIQVPSNGQPIILMADRQTTGGYPKIGQVISADLPSLAQLQPNSMILFEEVSLEQAEIELLKQEQQLRKVATGIRIKALFEREDKGR
ncbi:biotin-dependent carboxyltransferase family protein [Bacillus sp. S/N-304-OC-R1]|uniref:5-oxoprolinase subunit C family protein n=1 Tax=Bacillus sp. S/N-304-OC-R1 TaxID=2758034 RepID=UPI001C8D0CE7|nr:biotin-dependent carboxyltransferase family protein [Bacillus sp. S/N-304-OC-R1]MBY0123210.1 biotin-dependent carboxyltransferase family protein [Bacillus sp. S/N-304-OC-R1]